jgi:hypothetical protein
MSEHKLFSPSKAGMWINCPGSMAFPENQDPNGGSSSYADDGSATHHWGATFLKSGEDAHAHIDEAITINNTWYTLDEERTVRVQGYLDDVRRRAIGGYLFVERFVSLEPILGDGQGGTPDVSIVLPEQRMGIIEDLKDGSRERVYASYLVSPATDTTPEMREPNPQLALYALASLPDWDMLADEPIEEVLLVIYQPKLNHIDEFTISVDRLKEFGRKARMAVELATAAMASGPQSTTTLGYLNPGIKQCRWCRAATICPELAAFTERETRLDFEDVTSQPSIPATVPSIDLGKLYAKLPLIDLWVKAVKAELVKRVTAGESILGPDGKPYKFVEGEEGRRQWIKEQMAVVESTLCGQLGPEAYSKPEVVTAPQAEKLLIKKHGGKKKIENLWKDIFLPLIHRPRSQPQLVFGSDPRPAFTGAGQAEDFENIGAEE